MRRTENSCKASALLALYCSSGKRRKYQGGQGFLVMPASSTHCGMMMRVHGLKVCWRGQGFGTRAQAELLSTYGGSTFTAVRTRNLETGANEACHESSQHAVANITNTQASHQQVTCDIDSANGASNTKEAPRPCEDAIL